MTRQLWAPAPTAVNSNQSGLPLVFLAHIVTFRTSPFECKLVQPLWKTAWRVLKKLKVELLYVPAIPLLGRYPEKIIIREDTCTPLFIAALFTITKAWKQPKCPSKDEWIKKMWYIYTIEYYSAI